MKKQLFAALLCTALLAGGAQAVVDPPENSYVADYADVLSDTTETYIIEQNEALTQATGGAIEVVTVDFLDGMDIADYAYELFNTWGIGDGEANNGLLLLLAIGEEDYYAMPGSGIENALTAGTLDNYLWNYLEADFAAGDYDAGVRSVFDAFCGWYESYYGVSLSGGGAGVSAPSNPEPAYQPDYYYAPEAIHDHVRTHVGSVVGVLVFLLIILLVVVVVVADALRYRSYRRRYLLPGMPPPPFIYRPFIFGWPRGPRPPRPPRGPGGPRPPMGGGPGFGGGSFGGFGGGASRGGGAGRRH